MPRRVDISVAPTETDVLVERISGVDGLIGLRVQEGVSRKPRGDVISLEITNRGLPELVRLLSDLGVGKSADASFTTSEPISITSSPLALAIVKDVSDATWEEMEGVIAKNSNVTASTALLMAIAGMLATIGISTNALHLVVGAMLIAPGFQPIVRVALGIVGKSAAWRRGLGDIARGYLSLGAGAAVMAIVLWALGEPGVVRSEASYLPAGVLVSYWTTINVSSLVVTALAGVAGALLIATNRAVLTAGVMVALALVPGATIAAAALVEGELAVASRGAARWLIEVLLILLTSVLVLQWKQSRLHRRPAML
jgi:hypothetical protein